MSQSTPKDRVVVASDVSDRDGIGIEVYRDDVLVLEIFRNDGKRTREVTLYKDNVDLDFIEECIKTFKKEVPLEFQD